MVITGGIERTDYVSSSRRMLTPRDHLRFVKIMLDSDKQSIDDLTLNSEGAYTIVGVRINPATNEHYSIYRKYVGENARERALAEVTQLTRLNMDILKDDVNLETAARVYCVYDPQGKYIGGADYL